MCQTVAAGMQQSDGDGDLGAIVRSAGAACTSSPSNPSSPPPPLPPPPPPPLPPPPPSLTPNSASDTRMTFMELISGGGGLVPDLSSFTHNFPTGRHHPQAVKCEPMEEFDHHQHHLHQMDIFSSSSSSPHLHARSSLAGFVDDHLFSSSGPGGGSTVKSEIGNSLDLVVPPGSSGGFDCGSPSPAASPVKLEADHTISASVNNPSSNNSGGGKHQGSKRSRKMQQKRIVCVPVAGGGKPTGEVLPSDMWAWRKYGQKPIKGSPYPRGYYRCSSSKGCSARKQVERCRNDPTMLIITYTSEHNHPWPAHRNSLAGTTRIRPMAAAAAAATSTSDEIHLNPDVASKAVHHPEALSSENPFVSIVNSSDPMQVESHKQHVQQQQQTLLQQHVNFADIAAGFDNTSRSSSQEEDFFSELEELPELSSILEKGFLQYKSDEEGGGGSGGAAAVEGGGTSSRTAVDPFNLFSWSSDSNASQSLARQQQQLELEKKKKQVHEQ